MFPFKKPPSRAEVAKKAVADAVSEAAHTVSETVTDVAATLSQRAHDWIESAHDLVESSPVEGHVAGAAQKLGALKASAASGAALAGKAVADKVADARDDRNDSVPNVKRARKAAQAEIKAMNKQAEKYKRDLQKELERQQADYQAEIARLHDEVESAQSKVEKARKSKKDEIRVPIAPVDEVVAYDEDGEAMPDYDTEPATEKSGGSGWLLFGGLLLAGAGALYYLSTTGGKRKSAEVADRIVQVKEGVREKMAHDSDETGEAKTGEIAEAATEAFDRSNEKIADATVNSTGAVAESGLPEKAVEKLGDLGDSVADGIASAGNFIADKLEAAGAGAKSAAGAAAEKLDDAKDATTARLEARTVPPTLTSGAASSEAIVKGEGAATPDAVIIEIINDEPRSVESTDEILAEVEATVQSIENSVREGKKE